MGTDAFQYDVFISYSHSDEEWVQGWLLPRLKQANLRTCIDCEDFEPGAPSLTEMERAVLQSKKTLLVLTPKYLESEWCEFENILVQTLDPAARRRRVTPLLLEKCNPPPRIAMLTYLDFTQAEKHLWQCERVITALKGEWAVSGAAVETGSGLMPLPPQAYFAHSYPLQENFTGRLSERKMLTEWLAKDNRPVLAMIALGGMGKSALTWVWVQQDVLGFSLPGVAEARSVAEDARPEGLLWWSFYEREARFGAFLNKALVYVSGGTVNPANIPSDHDKAKALVNLLHGRRFLLILDGLERELRAYASLSAAYQGDEFAKDEQDNFRSCTDPHAAEFLRAVAALPLQSRVLITSRLFPRELEGLAGSRHEPLESMDPEDAVIFFHLQGVKGTRAEIQEVCEPCGYNPLALRLLAGVIAKDKKTPGDIQVAKRHPVLPKLKGKEQHHILQVAYDTLDNRKRALLSRIAAFRSPMTYDAVSTFNTYKKAEKFDAALDELIGRGLLFRESEQNRYDLHPIVRQYAYDRLGDKKSIHTRLRDFFSAVLTPDKEKVQSLEDLSPVIELYHHTIRAGGFDEAFELFRNRLYDPLYLRFGAYRISITLLHALFPDGEKRPPRLRQQIDQKWTLGGLGGCYCRSGEPRRAVALTKSHNDLCEKTHDISNLAVGFANLALQQVVLGKLRAAEENFRHSIELRRTVGKNHLADAASNEQLGLARLLAYRGALDESEAHLRTAQEILGRFGSSGTIFLSTPEVVRTERALLMGNIKAALGAARQARKVADEVAKKRYPYERDFVRAEWLLGAALVALAGEEKARRGNRLAEAESHLTEALSRCRRINLVDNEPDILLAWARWHSLKGDVKAARRDAEEALSIADRCEYRLNQADIHNFLARVDLEAGKKKDAVKHAQTAHERAWCDGPPHCYKPALDEAERLLKELGASPRK